MHVGDRVQLPDGSKGYVNRLLDADGNPVRKQKNAIVAVVIPEDFEWDEDIEVLVPVIVLKKI